MSARDHVVVSGSLPPGITGVFLARLARVVPETGARLVVDTSGVALDDAIAEGGVHVLKSNHREMADLLGQIVEDLDDARHANGLLVDLGAAEIVVTTVGDHGAVVSTASGHTRVSSPELPGPARSDVGAGDSFTAGMTLGLARGMGPADACRLGVAAAAAAVLTPGTETCRRDDVDALFGEIEVS